MDGRESSSTSSTSSRHQQQQLGDAVSTGSTTASAEHSTTTTTTTTATTTSSSKPHHKMSMTSKISFKLGSIFSNEKKSAAAAAANSGANAAASIESQQERQRRDEVLKCTRTSRLGFPYRPSSIAYDSVQRLLAVGTKLGYVKIFGAESIEYTLYHSPSKVTPNVSSSNLQNNNNNNSQSGDISSNNGAASATQSPGLAAANMHASSSSSSLLAPAAVLFMSFVINEGALITYCDDCTLSFWNLRQKQPGILFTKKLVNEKATCIYLPFKSNWLFVGTEKGNTYLLNIYNNFSQSGYDIKWNNVIELSQKTKPGKVVHLTDHPLDSSKMLIGFESGLICMWNLKTKKSEMHFYGTAEIMSSISWFNDGKQFMSSHNNGSLIVWNAKGDTKPVSIIHPHMNESDLIPRYNMIKKVCWESTKNGEPLIIFSDGLPSNDCPMKDAITIIRNNKLRTIIEMKEKIVDFILVNSSPWANADNSDPSALIVLLDNNLVVIDLKSDGYPQFQHHHSINLHESAVSACDYTVEPSRHFFQALVASRERTLQDTLNNNNNNNSSTSNNNNNNNHNNNSNNSTSTSNNNSNNNNNPNQQNNASSNNATVSYQSFSRLPYPINGGIKCSKSNVFGYNELITTGHEDGTVRLWDSSGLGLTLLHKLKTHKLIDRRKTDTSLDLSDAIFKVTALEVNGNLLGCASAGGSVTLYRFNSKTNQNAASEELADMPLLEIPVCYESSSSSVSSQAQQGGGGGGEATAKTTENNMSSAQHFNFPSPNEMMVNKKDMKCCFRTKIGFRKQFGFQPELICLLFWTQRPPCVNTIKIYPKSNLFFFGTDEAIIGVDYQSKSILINMPIAELYLDPYHRVGPKSPKKPKSGDSEESGGGLIDHVTHMLPKQLTIDASGSFRDTNSKSSSSSSLENLVQTEGVCCIELNDYSTMCNFYKIELHQTTTIQLWIGTTYGSVQVLNCTCQLMSSQVNSDGSGGNSSTQQSSSSLPFLKTLSILPSSSNGNNNNNTQHTLKGSIVNISFLDANLNPIQSSGSTSGATKSSGAGTASSAGAAGGGGGDDVEDDFLNLESEFNYTMSNSIADNFGGGGGGNQADGGNNSSPSPSNTPTAVNSTFVNPFANTPPPPPPSSANSVAVELATDSKSSLKSAKRALTLRNKHEANAAAQAASGASSAATPDSEKTQFVVLTSESQIKVISLPSHSCHYTYNTTDSTIARANVTVVNSLAYLTCYMSNGNFVVHNLLNPVVKITMSLNSQTFLLKERELMDRSIRTFTFGSRGHAIYMSSPSELQKILLTNANGTGALTEMLCELFDPKVQSPPPPKPNLFKSLFGQTPTDREELFGESSGKPSTCIVKNVEGEVNKAKKELTELQKLALERGEKLNALELKSEQMVQAASQFAKNANELANKYKSRKFF